ncbi:metalloregulator ArsR/SmtB family transcription factor [Bremerella sp. JC770]|uniref:ArsR/SmtB family transcription factor n=1 Tax=Bremerella sp. JC770 TaxID=3232137 RepID=UPI00345976EA
MDILSDQAEVEQIFRALSDRTRLRILWLLNTGELCVCDLVSVLEVPQPTASRHLAYLRKVGLVQCRKEGLWSYYRLPKSRSRFYKRLLACIESAAEESPQMMKDLERLRLEQSDCCQ